MKLNKFTTLGAVAGVVALSTTALAQQQTGASPSNYSSVRQADSQVIEGRIVTLADYLAGSGAHASLSGGTLEAGRLSSQRDPSQPGAVTSPTPGTQANQATRLGGLSSPMSTSATQPLVLISSRSSAGGSSELPGRSTTQPQGLGQDQNRTQPPTLTPGQTTTPDRPFGGTTPQSRVTPPAGQEDSTLPSTATSPSTGLSPSSSAYASMGSGQAYILIFNPQDPQSRAALTSAQSHIASAGDVSDAADSSIDRLRVRGREAADAASDAANDATDRLRDRTTAIDRSTTQPGRDLSLNRDVAGQGSEKQVKVTGKVMSRGGIQAIEVANIEPASASSIPRSGQGLQDSTRPDSTQPNNPALRDRGID